MSAKSLRLTVNELPADIRQLAGLRWADAALAEHASIASFSRFSLHLLAVGAPPDLIRDCHQAAIDEVKHARMCLFIASLYLGESISPGRLPLDGDIVGPTDLSSVVHAAVLEGCIGETISAYEATLAMEKAQFSELQKTLKVIAADELKHAQLSWRFIKWATEQQDQDVIQSIAAGFARVLYGVPIDEPQADDGLLEVHGLLGKNAQWQCQKQACELIVVPAAKALLQDL